MGTVGSYSLNYASLLAEKILCKTQRHWGRGVTPVGFFVSIFLCAKDGLTEAERGCL